MTRKHFDADGNFEYPLAVEKLSDVPFDARSLYVPAGARFTLDPAIIDETKDAQDEIAKLKKDIAAIKAETEATLKTLRAKSDDALTDSALHDAFTAAGVDAKLVRAAAALLKTTYRFETEDRDDGGDRVVIAADAFGLHTPKRAVERWLASPQGEAFRNKKATISEGHFLGLLSQLRQER